MLPRLHADFGFLWRRDRGFLKSAVVIDPPLRSRARISAMCHVADALLACTVLTPLPHTIRFTRWRHGFHRDRELS